MQANRYGLAAEAPIINTYVPINFNELYRIGLAQREVVEQASKELTGLILKFGEFQSPSKIDTDTYYRNTIGLLEDVIEEAAANPDALKDAGFRSRFQSKINNLDYSTLSQLKQSSEGIQQRQKVNQELMLRGLYNSEWHDIDATNYDTTKSGIFNDVSPLAYKSEVDLVKPFVDNLKASFMGTKDGWVHQGVTTDRTDLLIMLNLSSIQNTPEYAKHVEVLQKRGMTKQEAELEINKTLITAGREFAYEQVERDPWWVKSMEILKKAAADAAKNKGRLLNLTQLVHLDGKRTMYQNFTSLTPEELDLVTTKGIKALPKKKQDLVREELNLERIREGLQGTYDAAFNNTNDRNVAVEEVMSRVASPIDPEYATNIYGKYGTTGKPDSNGNYRAKKSDNFILEDDLVISITGRPELYREMPKERLVFTDMWNNGEFHDFVVAPEAETVTDGDRMYHRKLAYVPIEQFDNPKLTVKRDKKGRITEEGLKLNLTELGFTITTLDQAGDVDLVTTRSDYEGDVENVSTRSKGKKLYVQVPVTTVIPSRGQAAISADFTYNNKRKLRAETNETQNAYSEAMRFPYSNLDDDQ